MKHSKYEFDVALSFAGEDRELAKQVADYLDFFGVRVFYDEWEEHKLVGENLYDYLANIYQRKSRLCVIFISEHYVKKAWPQHERKFAQARAFVTTETYIIPIRVDDTECPGIPPTVAYIDSREESPSKIAVTLLRKIGVNLYRTEADEFLLSRHMRWEVHWNGTVSAHGQFSFLYVGKEAKERFTFSVWSPRGRGIKLHNLQGSDSTGELATRILARTKTSCEFAVYARQPMTFGDVLDYEVSYECPHYYGNVLTACKDNFSASLPIRYWSYQFVFPKRSVLEIFRVYIDIDGKQYRQTYSTTQVANHPVVEYRLKSPKPGSVLSIEFKLSKEKPQRRLVGAS